MSATSDRLGKQAMLARQRLQEIGEAVRETAEEKLAQAGAKTAEACEQGRDKVNGLACACEQYVSQRPLRSVLLAGGIGWLLGRFWKRR